MKLIAKLRAKRAHLTNGYSPSYGVDRTYCGRDIRIDKKSDYAGALPLCKACQRIAKESK